MTRKRSGRSMGNLAGGGLGLPAHDRRNAAAAGGCGVMTSITSLEEIRQQRQRLQGWRPLQIQLGGEGRKLERRGLIKIDWGPDYSRDADKLCAYLTDRGREALL